MTDLTATPELPASQLELLARTHEKEAFSLLVETIRNPDFKIEHRLKAAERILDQARGKPKVATAATPIKRQKLVEMSEETLLKLINRAQARQKTVGPKTKDVIIEGEIVQQAAPVRKAPRNEYALPALEHKPASEPATTTEDLLS